MSTVAFSVAASPLGGTLARRKDGTLTVYERTKDPDNGGFLSFALTNLRPVVSR